MASVKTWARAYRRGSTYREIAAGAGVDEWTVRRALRGLVDSRPSGPVGRTDVPTEAIADLRRQGYSWRRIGAEVGMSATGVRERLLGGRSSASLTSRPSRASRT